MCTKCQMSNLVLFLHDARRDGQIFPSPTVVKNRMQILQCPSRWIHASGFCCLPNFYRGISCCLVSVCNKTRARESSERGTAGFAILHPIFHHGRVTKNLPIHVLHLSEAAKHWIKGATPHDSPETLIFWYQKSSPNTGEV